jgi:glycosyltransferase involved in cell wall biosynthesis
VCPATILPPVEQAAAAVSVIVPVYESAETLDALVTRIEAALGERPWELILVNDGSTDGSWDAIARLAAARPKIVGIDLTRNFGQHNALLAGIRTASHPIAVTLDDDLQNPPEEIPRLLAKLDEGFDVVYGTAARREQDRWRRVAARLTRTALRAAMGSDLAEIVSPYRAFRTSLREGFAAVQGPYVSIDVLLAWTTTRFASVRVKHDPRAAGRSTYSFRKLANLALTMLTGFSTRPLRVASLIGLASTVFGLAVLVWVVGSYLIAGSPVRGFPFLASVIAIFGGAQLLTLGVIGEYLVRMHVRLMDRPAYAIRRHSDPVRADESGTSASAATRQHTATVR